MHMLVGESKGIVAVREAVQRLVERQRTARRLPPILILGETGTGKGLVARVIHGSGPRADGPFVSVNCAAIPESLLEAELFGYERGAFTDARQAKPGLFQLAQHGTVLLDEVSLLSLPLQAKLLTAIDERTVRRLGGHAGRAGRCADHRGGQRRPGPGAPPRAFPRGLLPSALAGDARATAAPGAG